MFEMFKFDNGDEVKEIITGLQGIVVAQANYLTGCIHYGVQPKKLKADGTMQDWTWVDESRLVLIKSAKIKKSTVVRGGPCKNPPQF